MNNYSMEEEVNGMPEPGDTIRTKKMQMEGKVERIEGGSVLFRIEDGRLMKTPINNVIVIQKLADEDIVTEVEEIDEVSNEVLAKYKAAAGKDASAADKRGDYERGNKRFHGIVQATKKQFANDSKKKTEEGTMSGINRWGPTNDVSYEKVLDEVKQLWEKEKLNELSVDKLKAYKDAATSPDVMRHAPLRKIAKHVQGNKRAGEKIATKTGDRRGMHQPDRGTYESRLQEFLEIDEVDMGDIVRQQNPEPPRTIEKEYNGWTIRYHSAPRTPGAKIKWMVFNPKKPGLEPHYGEASTPDQAYQDATAFINDGAGAEKKFHGNSVTVSFNVHFTRMLNPDNGTFYVKFEDGFIMVSLRPQSGFYKASPYRGNEAGERYWAAHMPTQEVESQKLVPNGRYTLGSKDEIDAETSMFDIHFRDVAASTNDKLRMKEPGFIVASPRAE